MAGGQGGRLRPLTDTVPKPMLRVAGRPILERIVLHLVGFGIGRIFISVDYLGRRHRGALRRRLASSAPDRVPPRGAPLGTGGALGLLPEPTRRGRARHERRPRDLRPTSAACSTSTCRAGSPRPWASGATSTRYRSDASSGRATASSRLDEKPTIEREVNSGIYAARRRKRCARVRPGTPIAMPDLIGELLDAGQPVGAFEIEDDWIDVGQRDQLDQARSGG